MRYVARTGGREYLVELEPGDAGETRDAVRTRRVVVDGVAQEIDLAPVDGGFHYSLLVGPASYEVFVERCEDVCFVDVEGRRYRVQVEEEREGPGGPGRAVAGRAPLAEPADVTVRSPMPGVVVAVLVETGQEVRTGEGLVIVEAMKMENEIRAPRTGVVEAVHVAAGQRVSQDDLLVRIG